MGFRQDVCMCVHLELKQALSPQPHLGMLPMAPDVMHLIVTVDLRCPSDDAPVMYRDLNK